MASLKNNLNELSEDTESLVRDYLKLFSIRQSKKLALLLAILSSVFIISLLLLIVTLFFSFALAAYLNELLGTDYWGFWIVAGFYVLLITLLIVFMLKTRKPMLTSLFIKFILFVFNIDINQPKSLDGLNNETENIRLQIETEKGKIKTDIQLLRYVIMESLFRDLFGLFTSKKKKDEISD